jgi:predicted amidophosphoribosyltransferase
MRARGYNQGLEISKQLDHWLSCTSNGYFTLQVLTFTKFEVRDFVKNLTST